MEDKKEVKDLIKVRKSIFSVIKEMLKEKLIPKKDFSVDIEREKNAFRTFDEIYGVDEEAYAIEQENLRIYDEIKDITSMNEVPEIKEETEVEILPETTTKDEFMQLYNDVVENRVSVKCLSISDLLKINLLLKEEIELKRAEIQKNDELKKEIETLEKENEELMKKLGNVEEE